MIKFQIASVRMKFSRAQNNKNGLLNFNSLPVQNSGFFGNHNKNLCKKLMVKKL
jgi:hypothetical protein